MRTPHAFTLIELLIVVAIIAVLAGIAVPNFLEAQTRSKLSRSLTDMAALETALRAYGAQHEAYPPQHRRIHDQLVRLAAGDAASADPNSTASVPLLYSGWDLTRLTTPQPWLSREFYMDPFCSLRTTQAYLDDSDQPNDSPDSNSSSKPQAGPVPSWIPAIRVPFAFVNLTGFDLLAATTYSRVRGAGYLLISHGPDTELSTRNPLHGEWVAYDPTNGTTSRGDLLIHGW